MRFLCIVLAFFLSSLEGASVFLYNDSPFVLTAHVTTPSGVSLGQSTLKPGEQLLFSKQAPSNSSTSSTPYTVTWVCPSNTEYSSCYPVSPGDMVSATRCPGSHFCKKEKPSSEKKKEADH